MISLNTSIKTLTLALFLIVSILKSDLSAQDFHFTQHWITNMYTNPALTGNFDGKYKIGGLFRSQWGSVDSRYRTIWVGYDHRFNIGLTYGDAVGAGVSIFQDNSGSGNLATLDIQFGGAYHKILGKNQFLSIGLQLGFIQKSISEDDLNYAEEYDETAREFINNGQSLPGNQVTFQDFNLGLAYNGKFSEDFNLRVGAAYFHATNPEDEGFSGTIIDFDALPSRITAQALANIFPNNPFGVRVELLYSKQAMFQEILTSSNLLINIPDTENTLLVGGGTRISDAFFGHVGIETEKFIIGASYDFTSSTINQVGNLPGAIEMSFTYINREQVSVRDIYVPAIRY